MNRALCLRRPEPRPADIALTGHSIIDESAAAAAASDADKAAEASATTDASLGGGANEPPPPPAAAPTMQRTKSGVRDVGSWLGPLANAYHQVYTTQHGQREFIGMRDYYGALGYAAPPPPIPLHLHMHTRCSIFANSLTLAVIVPSAPARGETYRPIEKVW